MFVCFPPPMFSYFHCSLLVLVFNLLHLHQAPSLNWDREMIKNSQPFHEYTASTWTIKTEQAKMWGKKELAIQGVIGIVYSFTQKLQILSLLRTLPLLAGFLWSRTELPSFKCSCVSFLTLLSFQKSWNTVLFPRCWKGMSECVPSECRRRKPGNSRCDCMSADRILQLKGFKSSQSVI